MDALLVSADRRALTSPGRCRVIPLLLVWARTALCESGGSESSMPPLELCARTAPSTLSSAAWMRLEDADYEGHSVAMLRRIAAALNQRVEIRFVPIRRSA